MQELHMIRKIFVDTLLSMHKKRIAYPKQEEINMEQQKGGKNS